MKTLTINMKRSGNYIVTEYTRPEWTVVGTANSPKELMEKINQLGNATIIKSEYSKSQSTVTASNYGKKSALNAFGLSTSQKEIDANF